MILHKGNMWDVYDEANHFIFTGNATIKNNGALVMGRGLAKEVRDKFPSIDAEMGKYVGSRLKQRGYRYGCIIVPSLKIGVFQVKYHFKDSASFPLIEYATERLASTANIYSDHSFHMNFPGIGYGNLAYNEVLPIVESLPNNVHLWTFK